MASSLSTIREDIFGVAYIMSEQSNKHSKQSSFSYAFSTLIYFIDAGQVLRAVVLPEFGWNSDIVTLAADLDFINIFFELVPFPPISRRFFFLLALGLVVLTFLNVAIVVQIFKKGRTSHLWTVMTLRALVSTLVTAFFMSIVRWLLFPVDCRQAGDTSPDTISTWLVSEDAPCQPWGSAEIVATVPALFLSVFFMLFSLITTILSFEVNPLSQVAGDFITGRVEGAWCTVRISAVFIFIYQAYITPIGSLVVLFLHTSFVFALHLKVLPFHNSWFNLIRGGIYASIAWAAFSSIIVVSFAKGQGSSTAQWALLAVGPICFLAGLVATTYVRVQLMSTVRRMREDSLGPAQIVTHQPGPSVRYDRKRRDPFSEFFDSDSKRARAFGSAHAAHASIRSLLHEKDERDVPLLTCLFEKAMEEYPLSEDLLMLHLIFLRFVFRGTHPSIWKEKETKLSNSDLRLDLKYALYSVDRKALNYEVGIGLGQDSMSAINMMEVTRKLEHARKRHQECIALLRGLWKLAEKSKREASLIMADKMLAAFNNTSETVFRTQKIYEDLLLKFPGSMSLHREYANFCDVILSDFDQAAKYQNGAEILEAGDTANNDETKSVGKSVQSSTTSHRSMQRHFIDSWSHAVMSSQRRALQRLKRMVVTLGLSLLLLSTVGFVVFDQYLLSTISEVRLSFLDRTMAYLQAGINSCITLRLMRLLNETDSSFNIQLSTARRDLQTYSDTMRQMHSLNYISPPTQRVADFFLQEMWTKRTVVGGDIGYETVPVNFWDLMNDFISSILVASQVSIANLQTSDFSLRSMNVQQRAASFIFDNFWGLSASLEEFYGVMLSEIGLLQNISDIVVYTLLCTSLAQLCLIAWSILHGVNTIFPSSQHALVGGTFIHSLPTDVIQKIHNFYLTSERNFAIIQDETAAKEFLEQTEDPLSKVDNIQNDEDVVFNKRIRGGSIIQVTGTLQNYGVENMDYHSEGNQSSGDDHDPADLFFLDEGGDGFASFQSQGGDYCGTLMSCFEKNPGEDQTLNDLHPKGMLEAERLEKDLNSECRNTTKTPGNRSQNKLFPMEVDDKICEMGQSATMTDKMVSEYAWQNEDTDLVSRSYSTERNVSSEHMSPGTSQCTSTAMVKSENGSETSSESSVLSHSHVSTASQVNNQDVGLQVHSPGTGQLLSSKGESTLTHRISSRLRLITSLYSARQTFSCRKDATKTAADKDQPSSQQADDETQFSSLLGHRSQAGLAWYFRVSAHRASLAVLIGLCCCVWLVPVRSFPAVINTANLIRGVRRSVGTVLLSGHVTRELILADGFSRISTSALYAQLEDCRDSLLVQVDAFRFGGYIDTERNYIRIGADFLGTSARDQYNAIMYQTGCPWRKDPSNCSIKSWPQAEEQGLYKFLMQYYAALGIVLAKYRPDPTSPGFFESRFDYVTTDLERVKILSNDPAVAFILENRAQHAIDGVNLLVNAVRSEKTALLDQMHFEVRTLFGVFMALVVVVFYGLLLKLAIGATEREITKMQAFVGMLPVQALTRQDMESVMRYFVPEGLDDDGAGGSAVELSQAPRRA